MSPLISPAYCVLLQEAPALLGVTAECPRAATGICRSTIPSLMRGAGVSLRRTMAWRTVLGTQASEGPMSWGGHGGVVVTVGSPQPTRGAGVSEQLHVPAVILAQCLSVEL